MSTAFIPVLQYRRSRLLMLCALLVFSTVSYVRSSTVVAAQTVSSGDARSCSGFKAALEGQSAGDETWSTASPTGWQELDLIPMRVSLCGGPATNETIRVDFDHTKTHGGRVIRGIDNL